MAEQKVQTCVNKTSVTFDDLEHARTTINNISQITDFDEKTVKVAFLSACIDRKRELISENITTNGTVNETLNPNIEKIKENLKEILQFNKTYILQRLTMYYQTVGPCFGEVGKEENTCKTIVNTVLCYPLKVNCFNTICPDSKFCCNMKFNAVISGLGLLCRSIANVDEEVWSTIPTSNA